MVGPFRCEQRLCVGADSRDIAAVIEVCLRDGREHLAENFLRHAGVGDTHLAIEVPAGGGAAQITEQSVRDGIDVHLIRPDVGEAVYQIRRLAERVERGSRGQREHGIDGRRDRLTGAARDVHDRARLLTRGAERMTKSRWSSRDLLRAAVEYRAGGRERPAAAESLCEFAQEIDLRRRGLNHSREWESALIGILRRLVAARQERIRLSGGRVGIDQIAGDAVRIGKTGSADGTWAGIEPPRQTRPIGGRECAVAIAAENFVRVVPVDSHIHVVTVAAQVTHTPNAGAMLGSAVAVLSRASLHREFRTHVGLFQFDVDHTRNGIRAVHRRSAVLEYLDSIHRVERDGGHVDEATFAVIAQGIGHHTFAVDQGQRVAHRQAAQGDAGRTGGERLTEALVQSSRAVRREIAQHVRYLRIARILQVLRGNDLHGTRRFRVRTLDQGSRHHDLLQFGAL